VDSLFDELSDFDRDRLAAELARLAERHIYIGGSSWKYEGWIGQIYSRSRYFQRGRFSRKLFEATCLAEYAATFPTVCGDFAFYQFPGGDFWKKLFEQVPDNFRFALKVPEQITRKVFPEQLRYGPQAGEENESFLNAGLFYESFLRPLEPYRDRTALLIFEFGHFTKHAFPGLGEFLERLDPFLAQLPREFRYSVEIRNAEFLERDYFECLRNHGVAHVYNAWSRMPELHEQLAIPESITSDFLVCRALLRRGRSYEEAVKLFSPYTEVKDPIPRTREALRDLIRVATDRNQILFLFVNNRLEGNAPGTIVSLVQH
jgi:uncharacterized protein YecE (DUF72 family)